jgi:hypothetical protein
MIHIVLDIRRVSRDQPRDLFPTAKVCDLPRQNFEFEEFATKCLRRFLPEMREATIRREW